MKIKKDLKTATEIAIKIVRRISLQNGVFSNSKVETFFVAEN